MKLEQVSFTAGEVSPAVAMRADLEKFQSALKTCLNCIVDPTGGFRNRAGFQFVAQLDGEHVLIPFVFSDTQAYMLAFGEETIKVFANGGFIATTATLSISNIQLQIIPATPQYRRLVTTSTSHGLVVGQPIVISGVNATGAYLLDGSYTVTTVPSANTFTTGKATYASGAYSSGGTVGTLEGISTDYQLDELGQIRYTQSADILTLTHQGYMPSEFRRLSATTFSFGAITDFNSGPFLPDNATATTLTPSAVSGNMTFTASTSIFEADHVGALIRIYEEDLSGIPPWEPSKLMVASGGNPNGQLRRANGKVYECVTDETAGADGTYTGTVRPSHEEGVEKDGDGNAIVDLATRAGVEWEYLHSGFGIARITAVNSGTSADATVLSRLPSTSASAVWAFGAWSDEQGYPKVATYYQDRMVFACTPGQPQTEWASQVGDYHNFGISSPLVDSDSITQTLNARRINGIRDLVPLDQLIALTSTSSWASPQRGEALTPETIGFYPQSGRGAADLRAIIVDDSVIFVEDKSTRIRDLQYSFEADKFSGGEINVLSRHLFTATKTIVDMDYATEPDGILWSVRSDGVLVGCTYLREQQVAGFHRHTTQGEFKRVCVIPEDGRDAVYAIVLRTINGEPVYYLERLASRDYEDIVDAVHLDSSISFDGRNTTATTLTLSGSSFDEGDTLTCTASASAFSSTDDGNEVRLISGDDEIRCRITGYTSATIITVEALSDVPVSLQAVATAEWSLAYDEFSGLDHLEGETVSALVDGSDVSGLTVTDGIVDIGVFGAVVHIGLPYVSDIETLNITQGRDAKKNIPELTVVVKDTREFKAGKDADHLDTFEIPYPANYDDPTQPYTGAITKTITNSWGESGRVLVRQDKPLPLNVLAVIPNYEAGR